MLSKDLPDLMFSSVPQPKKWAVAGEIDCELVKRIVEDRRLGFVYESISALPTRVEAIRRYGASKKVGPHEIKRWIEPLMPKQL